MEQILDIRPVKARLRSDLKKKRLSMPQIKKNIMDRKIQNRLMNLWAFREASLILTYVSTPIEVDTHYMIETALKIGKTVAVPKCREEGRLMEFYHIQSLNELSPGAFGVLEPLSANKKSLEDFEGSLCIVPGFSFDKEGFRLGYGKGYYDRFLKDYTGTSAGICYSDCVKEHLPHGKNDRIVHMLITEKDTYNISE
ncbi:MAG: 5-formyltetrahydrofolate cyclo-ligase family protein [Firmicutes bacterium ADurb.Bin300]|nr:MAG: 5-formyltetrahydrofolate cyclo-ligase family protein [Firmicutes bacterium ADurb.Bin300]